MFHIKEAIGGLRMALKKIESQGTGKGCKIVSTQLKLLEEVETWLAITLRNSNVGGGTFRYHAL